MKWSIEGDAYQRCRVSADLIACVYESAWTPEWFADIEDDAEYEVADLGCFPTEAAAKSAVAAWIGKTIAQLGNALAAGEQRPYEQDDGA